MRPSSPRIAVGASLVVALIAGCEAAEGPVDATSADVATGTFVEPKSGVRLTAYYLKQGDAVLTTGLFHDTKYDEDCWFRSTAEGMRCVPSGTKRSGVADGVWASEVFLDASCREVGLAIQSPERLSGKRIATSNVATGTACGYHARVFEVGAPRVGQGAWTLVNGACTSIAGPTTLYEASPVDLTDFVRGSLDRVDAGPDLDVRRLRGDDGSVLPFGVFDRRRNESCSARDGRCVPIWAAPDEPSMFDDASCTKSVGLWGPGFGDDRCQPSVVRVEGSCSSEYFEAGPVATTTYGGASCAANSPSIYVYYRRGAPIPTTDFPAVSTRTRSAGEATLRETLSSTGKVLAVEPMSAAIDRVCFPQRMTDEKVRCVPQPDEYFTGRYGDASCSAPVVTVAATTCANPTRPRWVRDGASARYFETTGARRNGTVYFRGSRGCVATGTSDFYELQPARDIAFAELSVHEEPYEPGGSSSGGSSSSGSSSGGSSSGGSSSSGSSSGGSSSGGSSSGGSSSSGDADAGDDAGPGDDDDGGSQAGGSSGGWDPGDAGTISIKVTRRTKAGGCSTSSGDPGGASGALLLLLGVAGARTRRRRRR